MKAFLTRLYPFLFLALVVCGPVLLLPHTMPVFFFVASLDAILAIAVAAIVAVIYALHIAVPEKMQAAFQEIAAKYIGASRTQKIGCFLDSTFRFCSMTLLIVSAHPFYACFSMIAFLASSAAARLLAKVHAAASKA